MVRSLSVAAVLIFCLSSACSGELEELDEVGRRIAEKPCPKPRIATRLETNVHDRTLKDKYVSQVCPRAGSEVVSSSISQYKQILPLSATVSTTDSRVPAAFQVGTLLTRLKSRLGTPEVEKADSITYLLPSETRDDRVTFIHDGKRVVQIQWSWYFD
jgi:hypothetical protein